MRYIQKVIVLFLAFSLLIFTYAPTINASERSFDEIYSYYRDSRIWDKNAEELTVELRSMADVSTGYDLWRSLWNESVGPEKRVANAIKLMDELYPGSDLRRWNEVKGFWYPSRVPKPLAAIDTVYVAALELLKMDNPGAAWLARNLINELSRYSRAKHYFMKTAPVEYKMIIDILESKGMNPVIGRWPQPEIKGTLPLAVPVRGVIDSGNAISRNYIFLNGSGQITSFGSYAWNRSKGKLYRVAHREDNGGSNIIYFPRP